MADSALRETLNALNKEYERLDDAELNKRLAADTLKYKQIALNLRLESETRRRSVVFWRKTSLVLFVLLIVIAIFWGMNPQQP